MDISPYYAQTYPDYQPALDLLQRQASYRAAIDAMLPPPGQPLVKKKVALARWQTGQPLFDDTPLPVTAELFRRATEELTRHLPPGDPLNGALARLLASTAVLSPHTENLLHTLQHDGDGAVLQLAQDTSATPESVAFLLQLILAPFFEAQAAPYRPWLAEASWRRGLCPVCGSEPDMARLTTDDGRRMLSCSLCRTEWAFDRLRCPLCEHDGPPEMRHFTFDGDSAHRVDCCDHCHRYVKTVDERRVGHAVNLAAEDIVTAELDEAATEQGYHR